MTGNKGNECPLSVICLVASVLRNTSYGELMQSPSKTLEVS